MNENGWALETVRGRESGKVYSLAAGETVLGNALDGSRGIDLSHQEGEGPRRMAARQAQLDCSPQGLLLRDLDSPGGTFVNRQRILAGQAKVLQPGDLIQLGGVQLKVVRGESGTKAAKKAEPPAPAASLVATPPAKPASLAASFVLASGATCRTWDDFLTVSAQRWSALRDELTSGRLAAFLNSIQRAALAPSPHAPGTPDERLDAWLANLPTSRPSKPELEVNPESLVVRATGGGVTRQAIQLSNTGYRLLRSTIHVEGAASSWIKLDPALARSPLVTVDQTRVSFDVEIPEKLDHPKIGALVIESNGGSRRVEVRLERPPAPDAIPDLGPHVPGAGGPDLVELLAGRPVWLRVVLGIACGLILRMLVGMGSLVPLGSAAETPGLAGAAIVYALSGGTIAAVFARKRGEPRDVPPSAFAGACGGILAAALILATSRTIEPVLGSSLAANRVAVALLWAAIGGTLAGASVLVVPFRPRVEAIP
jgi:hypothetical protein